MKGDEELLEVEDPLTLLPYRLVELLNLLLLELLEDLLAFEEELHVPQLVHEIRTLVNPSTSRIAPFFGRGRFGFAHVGNFLIAPIDARSKNHRSRIFP